MNLYQQSGSSTHWLKIRNGSGILIYSVGQGYFNNTIAGIQRKNCVRHTTMLYPNKKVSPKSFYNELSYHYENMPIQIYRKFHLQKL